MGPMIILCLIYCRPTKLFSTAVYNFTFPPAMKCKFKFLLISTFFLIYFLNGRIFALQNFVVFCHTSTRISHRYTHVPSLHNLLPISLPTPPFQIVTELLFEFPQSYSKFPLSIYFTYGSVSFHVTLSMHLTLSSPLPCL